MFRQKSVKPCLSALGFNLLVLAVLLLLFEPTPKSDDYDIAMILYGGFTGEFSPHMLYSNILLGKVIQGLMYVCPSISWYYIMQYIGLVLSFSAVTYVIIKKSGGSRCVLPCLMFLLFCGYECYIRITFTKTAGILIIAGFLFILYQIESKETFGLKYFFGIGLIFWGMCIRTSMYQLIAAIFAAAFVIFLLEHRGMEQKELRKWSMYFIVITAGLWLPGGALRALNDWQLSQDSAWQVYSEVNVKRALLNDYGWPAYEEHRKEYEKLGVSANDIEMWKRYGNINDTQVLTPELMDDIRTRIPIGEGASLYQKLDSASKGLLSYYFNDTGIYLFLLFAVCLGVYRRKGGKLRIGLVSGVCVFAYYYMYCRGRLQHHVDVAVLIAGSALLLYYLFPIPEKQKEQKHLYVLAALLAVAFILKFYVGLSTSSYYAAAFGNVVSQKEQFQQNREQLDLLSADEEHLYLFGAYETNWIYDAAWSVMEVVTPGYYHNLYMMNRYEVPDDELILANYGVKNAYREMTNSKMIYFADSGHVSGQIETLCQYIREHYCPEAEYTLVKKLDGLNIYRFTEGDVTPAWTDGEIRDGEGVRADIQAELADGILRVSGYAFVDGTDSYAQNIYLCTGERGSDEEVYSYALQTECEQSSDRDKRHGKYSAFYCERVLEEHAEAEDMLLTLYLDTGTDVYCLPVAMPEES